MQLLIEAGPDDKSAAKRLKRLEKRLGGSTELMEEIAGIVAEGNKTTFRAGLSQVTNEQTGRTLAGSTVEWKRRYGRSEEPLVESGEMKEELTTEKGVKLITPTELRFGSSSLAEGEGRGRQITVAKASLLQKGTRHQKKHEVLKVTPTRRRLISSIVIRYMAKDD
jgi:hypothetical protein